jgi:hypothetical protein
VVDVKSAEKRKRQYLIIPQTFFLRHHFRRFALALVAVTNPMWPDAPLGPFSEAQSRSLPTTEMSEDIASIDGFNCDVDHEGDQHCLDCNDFWDSAFCRKSLMEITFAPNGESEGLENANRWSELRSLLLWK